MLPCLKGLPRIRGDRPLAPGQGCRNKQATPHTRGSTPIQQFEVSEVTGYPAYAGIDHHIMHETWKGGGLPRIRGDRPWEIDVVIKEEKATPHTRGSTRRDSNH